MLSKLFINLFFYTQVLLFNLSILACGLKKPKSKKEVVIGVDEVASLLFSMGSVFKDAKTVSLSYNQFYQHFDYGYNFGKYASSNIYKFVINLLSPLLLGFLVTRYKKFIYLSDNGFLLKHVDGRSYEFKKINANGGKVVCYFTGSDIRSFKLLDSFGKKNNIDVITTYQSIYFKNFDYTEQDDLRKMLGHSASKYAAAIFNAPTDQMAYIDKKTYPLMYFYDEENIACDPNKFLKDKKVVMHAPSSPIVKGTPIVRAAIKQLVEEGYDFEYVELLNIPHSKCLSELSRAHIVLNEFYSFVPGVLGVEAMASQSVLLTSANKNIEKTLPGLANDAWIVTPYYLVYKNLKKALDSPMSELEEQANQGKKWVEKYCSKEINQQHIRKIIDELK